MCLGCLWLSFVVFCMEVDHINNSLCADEIEYLMINVTLKSNTAIETQAGFIYCSVTGLQFVRKLSAVSKKPFFFVPNLSFTSRMK